MAGAVNPKAFALTAAALLVLVGFSAAFAGLSAATETAAAGKESDTDPAFGGNGLTATVEFGGYFIGSSPDFLVLLEITATTDSVTLTATISFDSEVVLDVAGITANLGVYDYYLTDHLGSTRKVLDTASSPPHVTFSAEYAPFGEAFNVAGSERFRFTGEQHDAATGFTHLRARQYDPATGRFTGADPILGSLSHPQTQNRYAYAVGNPGRYTDPSGTCIWDLCIGETLIVLGLLAVAGIAIAAASQYVPEFRPVADAFATVFGFIPLFGDVYSTAYFLTQDAFECQTGGCDWGAIGLDAVGIVPGIPNLGGGVHALKAIGIGLTVRTANRAGDAARAGFRSFDAGNFRHNLEALTGLHPEKRFQAHHVFPQKFGTAFGKAGINIHNPHFGTWVKAADHAGWSARYNTEWTQFLKVTRYQDEILEFGRSLSRRYGFDVHF